MKQLILTASLLIPIPSLINASAALDTGVTATICTETPTTSAASDACTGTSIAKTPTDVIPSTIGTDTPTTSAAAGNACTGTSIAKAPTDVIPSTIGSDTPATSAAAGNACTVTSIEKAPTDVIPSTIGSDTPATSAAAGNACTVTSIEKAPTDVIPSTIGADTPTTSTAAGDACAGTSIVKTFSDVVTARLGTDFTLNSVAGDGNCAFTAIGKTRAEVVTVLKAAIRENFESLNAFTLERSAIYELIKDLTPSTDPKIIEDILIRTQTFITTSRTHYRETPSIPTPAGLAQSAFDKFKAESGSSVDAFNATQESLQHSVLNLSLERYEAFQMILQQELIESGVKPKSLDTVAGFEAGIETVFAKNAGHASWLPVGLIMGVQERLGLNLAIWSARGQPKGTVKLYQFNGPSSNLWDSSVRHIVWSGIHFDILTPTR